MALAPALGQRSSVEVRTPGPRLFETAPGRIVSTSVVVSNRGNESDDIVEQITIPAGCQKIAPPDLPFRLEPGGQMVRVIAVVVPTNMPAGTFEMRYLAQSKRDPSSIDSVDLTVNVLPVDDLELIVDAHTDVVLAGDEYPIQLRVANHGNSRISVRLEHRSSLKFPVKSDAAAFQLEPGATREVTCRVKTDPAYAKHTKHAVTFDVTATSISGKVVTASQASVAEIIPRFSGSRDPFHYLPMQFKVMTLAEDKQDLLFQAELSGAGTLDEEGKHQVDFLFRGPDAQTSTFFGERDEYGATYRGEHFEIAMGDRVYSLSPLTQKQSLGRGLGVKWHDEGSSAGIYYMTTRFRQQNTKELGAFFRQEITPAFSLQANFLYKSGPLDLTTDVDSQNILSLEGRYRFGKQLDLRMEVGLSLSDNGQSDTAYRIEARGELPSQIKYVVEHVRAGPNFYGYFTDTRTTNASVSKAITKDLRITASVNQYAGNLAQNDIRSSVVNRESSWNVGADYVLNRDTTLSVALQHVERADILKPVAYDFTSDAIRMGVGRDFGKIKLQSFLELGTLDNALTGEGGPFQRYSVSAHWQPTARQTYSVSGSYGPSSFTGSTAKELSINVAARWQVRDNLAINLSYGRNQFDGLTGHQQDQWLASLRYQFENKSSLALVGRWSRAVTKGGDSAALNESAVFLSYSVPLNQPVSRKRSIGGLRGRLTNSSKGRESGIARVVLQIGEQFAVTDETGVYEFPALKPGECELQVVPDSLGPRLAMVTPLPMKLKIRAAQTTHADLTATAACSVSVSITRFAFTSANPFSPSTEVREVGGQEGVAIELSNGREIWRAQTDRTGSASFDRLPAGRWSIRAAMLDQPPLTMLENAEQVLTLTPGKAGNVSLRVMPQRRTLRVLDRGTIR